MKEDNQSKSKLALELNKVLDDLFNPDKVLKGFSGERYSRMYSKTAFNKLIMAQNSQIQVITDAYEEEIKDLNIAVESLTDKIASLEAEKEELEEKLLDLEKKDQTKEHENEPQPKACQ